MVPLTPLGQGDWGHLQGGHSPREIPRLSHCGCCVAENLGAEKGDRGGPAETQTRGLWLLWQPGCPGDSAAEQSAVCAHLRGKALCPPLRRLPGGPGGSKEPLMLITTSISSLWFKIIFLPSR